MNVCDLSLREATIVDLEKFRDVNKTPPGTEF